MAKSISSSLKQLLQKGGDALAKRNMSREDFVKAAEACANQPRASVNRNWGDQSKDGKQGFAYKK